VSFILDALRKSEHERQRSALPSLSHVPTASPESHLPRWATFVMALLAAAVLVLAGAWWQSERASPAGATAPPAVVERPLALPAPPSSLPAASPTSVAPQPVLNSRPLADAARRPPDEPLSSTSDAAPSPSTAAPGEQPLIPPAASGEEAAVPSAAALLAQGITLPNLRLELHAYAEQPASRFVFINGRRYGEGERLSDGPDLVAIGPQGAVLSYRGQRFLLMPE
jgi:general secretion pathway protein B